MYFFRTAFLSFIFVAAAFLGGYYFYKGNVQKTTNSQQSKFDLRSQEIDKLFDEIPDPTTADTPSVDNENCSKSIDNYNDFSLCLIKHYNFSNKKNSVQVLKTIKVFFNDLKAIGSNSPLVTAPDSSLKNIYMALVLTPAADRLLALEKQTLSDLSKTTFKLNKKTSLEYKITFKSVDMIIDIMQKVIKHSQSNELNGPSLNKLKNDLTLIQDSHKRYTESEDIQTLLKK